MLEVGLSLLVSFGWAWHGRDRVWTPKFEGSRQERFVKAVQHYRVKMGIKESFAFELHEKDRYAKDPHRCSSVEFDGSFDLVRVTWWGKGKGCDRARPEYWALHEACHVRYAHHLGQGGDNKSQEHEAFECMKLYSDPSRR